MADDWDDIVGSIGAETGSGAINNVAMQRRNPALVARAKRLADQFGIGSPLVEADPAPFEEQDKRAKAADLFDNYPDLVPYMHDHPDTAAMVTDEDFSKLGNISGALGMHRSLKAPDLKDLYFNTDVSKLTQEQLPSPKVRVPFTAKDYVTKLPVAAVGAVGTGVAMTAQGVLGAAEAASDIAGYSAQTDAYFRQQDRIAQETFKNLRPDWATEGWQADVFNGVASTIQTLLPLPLGKAWILPSLVAVTGFQAYGKYQGRGAGVGQSLLGGAAEGAIEFGTEVLPTHYLTNTILGGGIVKGGLKKFALEYALGELGGEQLATLGQDAVDTAIANPDQSWADYWAQRPQAALSTLIATATTGALMIGSGHLLHQLGQTVAKSQQAMGGIHGQAILDEIMRNAENTPLRKTSPEEFARMIDTTSASSPVRNVFIPIEAIDKALASETLPEEEKALLTVYQSQIDEARVNNGEVVIPIGEAAANLSGTKVWENLREDARVLAGGISGREAREQMDNILAELEQVGDETLKEVRAAQPAQASKTEVYEAVKAQVIKAGRSEREAQTTAALVASRAETLASARYGQFKNAKAAYNWMQLQIRGEQAPKAKGGRKVAQSAVVNIGLDVNDGSKLTVPEVVRTLQDQGVDITEQEVRQSGTEPTLIAKLNKPLTPEQAHAVSTALRQDAIAQKIGDTGELFGPAAEKWGPFNPEYFLDLTPTQTLQQSGLGPLEQLASADGALEVAKSQKFPNMRDFKLAVQNAVRATGGNLRDRARLTRLALADARLALQNNTNAIGWYGEKMEQALGVLGQLHPEINSDPDARFAFIYALSVTSNGLKVMRNFQLADIVYRQYKATGKMPLIGEGHATKAMQKAFTLFNQLTERMGIPALRDFMTSEHTVGEVEKALGVPVNGEHKGTKVKGAAFLGPKIGNGYFSNLYGDFNSLTMDRWFIRTWGRWTGTLVQVDPSAVKLSTQRVKTLLRDLSAPQRKELESIIKRPVKLSEVEEVAKRITIASAKEAARARINAIHPRLRLDAQMLARAVDGQKEAPQGPGERNEIRALMGPVLAELQRDSPELTMADLQAVLWYPEKKLYDTARAKTGVEAKLGYENEEAPDYANAAVALARAEGIDEEKIDAALKRARGRVAAAQRAARAGRDAERNRDGRRTVPEDENGFPLEEVLSSYGDGQQDPVVLQQFGGLLASLSPEQTTSLGEAITLEGSVSDEELWGLTGWLRGPDGKWRFEMDDSQSQLQSLPSPKPLNVLDAVPGIDFLFSDPTMMVSAEDMVVGEPLSKVLSHPSLFKHYPSLANLPVFIVEMPARERGYFDGYRIVLNPNNDAEQMHSTLHHEIQHAVQLREGFANGASASSEGLRDSGYGQQLDATIEYYKAIAKGEIPGMRFTREMTDAEIEASAAFNVYERVAGESEARAVQSRLSYSPAERKDWYPALSATEYGEPVLLPQREAEQRMVAQSTEGPAPPRGETSFYPSGKTIIQLFKADYSTLVHELSHVFLVQEFRLAQEPGASDELKADIAKLTKWFADHGAPIGEDGTIPVEAHELFARTGERYFREGKAPSAELRSTFKQLREWMVGVYKQVKDLLAFGPAPINPEISEIFDRIIATSDAIDTNATQPMTQEELGMTSAEYTAYLASVTAARDAAYDSLLERMMASIRRREDKRARAQRADVRADVAADVNSDPRFIALHLLRTGRWLNDPSREATPVKINTGWLIDNYGDEVLNQLPVGLQPLHRGDGLNGDDIAEMVGMPSGDALVQSLRELKQQADALKAAGNPRPLRDQVIEDLTNEVMAKRHGDIAMDEQEIQEEAVAALNATRQGEVLATELRQLKKKAAKPGVVTPYQILREWARRKANEGKVSDAVSKETLRRYIRLFNKARTAFENAILDGKADEAIKQKQAQMINHALLAEGKVVADEIGAIVTRMQRYAKTKAMSSIDQDYMDRIHELLEGYNFRPVSDRARAEKASFEEWAAGQRAQGNEVHVPARFRDDRTHWKDAQVSKLYELNDMVQSLVALGKLKQRLTSAEEERALQATVDETEAAILNLPERLLPEASTGEEDRPLRQSWREAKSFGDYSRAILNLFSRRKMREFGAGLVKIEGMLDIFDGNHVGVGPLNRVLVQGATDAANMYSQLTEEVLEPIIKAYKGMSGKLSARLNNFVTINELTLNVSIHPEDNERIGRPLTIPRRKLLGLVANTGNLSNLTKMVGGEKWGDPESMTDLIKVRDTLIGYLTKEEMDLVQAMWDGVNKLWPHIARGERQMSGIVPEEVVPMDVETPWGTYHGGYWPVVYDSDRSEIGRRQGEEAEESLLGAGFGISTPKGHTITRTAAMAPIEWSLEHVLFAHTTKVVSRIAYAPWIRDALKVIDNPRVRSAMKLRLGNEYQAAIRPWMKDQIPSSRLDTQGSKFYERFLDQIRINMSAAVLGVSYSTGIAQALGLSYSAGVLGEGSIPAGGRWMAAGFAKMIQLQKKGKGLSGAQEFVFARSPEMQRRAHEVNQESAEVFRRLKDQDTVYRRMQAAAFWHIGFIDLHTVSIPTWLGAYEKAKAQGMTEIEASAYGDKAVRLSQGSGRKKDMAAIQRGNAGQKFIAMFYTPSSVFFNQQWEAVQHMKAGNWSNAIAPTFWFLMVTTLLDAMRDGDWPDDEDGVDVGDIAKWVGRNLFFGMFYGVPVARDVSNTSERLLRGEYAEWGTTPLTALTTTVVKGVKSGAKVAKGEKIEGRDIKNEASAIGYLFGLPGNQIGKSAGFVEDVRTGKVQPHGVVDWFTGLTSGKLPGK